MTAAIQVARFGPERTAQVEIGAFYLVRGNDSFGEAIPEQIIRVESKPRYPFVASPNPVVKASVWMALPEFDGLLHFQQHDYPLSLVNTTDHGTVGAHDRHLERVELENLLTHPDYGPLARDMTTRGRMIIR